MIKKPHHSHIQGRITLLTVQLLLRRICHQPPLLMFCTKFIKISQNVVVDCYTNFVTHYLASHLSSQPIFPIFLAYLNRELICSKKCLNGLAETKGDNFTEECQITHKLQELATANYENTELIIASLGGI